MPDLQPLLQGDPLQVGEYRLIGRLGTDVFVGEPASSATERVVVKLLHPDLDRERFLRVIEPVQEVSAFCTAQVLESGVLDGRPYVVSEYIDGPTLEETTEAGTRLRDAALHRLAVGTVTALVAIHQAGTVHGDIRPGNVVLGPDGPRVINFGVSRALSDAASATTRKVGIPAFTAPERLRGDEMRPPGDLFSWAATVASAASGRSPFDGGSMAGTVNRIVNAEPELPDLGDLHDLVASCLDKDPGRRPTSSDVLLRLVGETTFLTARTSPPPPPPPSARPIGGPPPPGPGEGPAADDLRPARRGRAALIAVAGFTAGALLAGTGVYALTGERRASAAAPAPSPAVTGGAAAVLTAAPVVTAVQTSAPVASVAPKADREVKLPDIRATLHENSADPVWLATYLQVSRPFKSFARERSGTFKEVGLAEEPVMSPGGEWVALNPWVKFQNSDTDRVKFLNLRTNESFAVTTVKKPSRTMFPTWSRDGRRLLMSVVNEKGELVTGFAVIDVVARTATVVDAQYSDAIGLPFTFTPTGEVARGYSGSKSNGIDFYDMSGKVARTMHWVGAPRDLDWYSPSGLQFVTICPNKDDICVWDARTGDRKATVPGLSDDGNLLGWFGEDHLLVQEPTKKGKAQIKIMDFLGRVKRVLADLVPDAASRNFADRPR
ncbi:serine/threonine protein kinase [Sphaerisporangium dianthi]|uniref:non-specific serine/threonine protein kinase n=1 Tax=Sphaerisporangium dianthi TaxID=1436120 RepID=A0ABV9CCV3_9ACTN